VDWLRLESTFDRVRFFWCSFSEAWRSTTFFLRSEKICFSPRNLFVTEFARLFELRFDSTTGHCGESLSNHLTMNDCLLVVVPPRFVTLIGPVVAPAGTVALMN